MFLDHLARRCPLLLLAVPGLLTRVAIAQELPPLETTLEVDSSINPELVFKLGFMRLKIEAPAAAAGIWCIPMLDFSLPSLPPEYPTWAAALEATTVELSTMLPALDWGSSLTSETCLGFADDGSFVSQCLGPDPSVSPQADPLANTGSPISQLYGANPVPGWVQGVQPYVFSMDAMMQFAAWRRLQDLPEFANTTMDEFFNDQGSQGGWWSKLLMSSPSLSVMVVGMRTSSEPPLLGGIIRGLVDYPNIVPKLTRSPQKTITYVGTGATAGFSLWSQWTGPWVPIYTVAAGDSKVLHAAGYRPNMQVALIAANGARVECRVSWEDLGYVRVHVPEGTPSGFYDLREYRYLLRASPVTWTVWKQMPAGYIPRFLVP
jgi:hypothetical protein